MKIVASRIFYRRKLLLLFSYNQRPCDQRTGSKGSSNTHVVGCAVWYLGRQQKWHSVWRIEQRRVACPLWQNYYWITRVIRAREIEIVCEGGERVRRKASPHSTTALTALRIVRTNRSQVRFTFVTGQRAHPSEIRRSWIFLTNIFPPGRWFIFSFWWWTWILVLGEEDTFVIQHERF